MNDNMNAYDLTVSALRDKGLDSDAILEVLANLFRGLSFHVESQPKSSANQRKEDKLRDLFLKLGIPRHLRGYSYAFEAVLLYDLSINQSMTKDIYQAVAQVFGTTNSRVERAIRHAVECAWDRCNFDELDRLFGNTISGSKGKPTNSEFIAMCAEWLDRM